MSGYQFIHIETYGRQASRNGTKQSMKNMALEAERFVGACPHIESPRSPKLMFGISPLKAVELARKRGLRAKDTRGRKLRSDAQLVLAGVVSYPTPLSSLSPDDKDFQKWLKLNHKYLTKKYGSSYKTAILHVDESYAHIHFICVPQIDEDGRLNIGSIHQGIMARDDLKGESAKIKMRAYKDSMRSFQEEYYEMVGKPCGLTKDGPKRRRLTRKQWKDEQAAAERQADAIELSVDVNKRHKVLLEKEQEFQVVETRIKSESALLEVKKEKYLGWAANKSKTIKYLKLKIEQLTQKVKELKTRVSSLQVDQKSLHCQLSDLESKNRQLESVNEKLAYQSEIKSKGLQDLQNEFYSVLKLVSVGNLKEINIRYNNNKTEYDL